jgi:hypothetical protein
MYIRTNLISKNLHLVVDTTNDINYVNSTNLEWTELNNQSASLGDYFYNGEIVSTHDTERYNNIVAPILYEIEENYKKENNIQTPDSSILETVSQLESSTVEPLVVNVNQSLKDSTPPPTARRIADIPNIVLDINHYNQYKLIKEKVDVARTRIQNNSGISVNTSSKTITFDPVLTFSDGETQQYANYVESDIANYITYLTNHSGEIAIFLQQVRDAVANTGGPVLD